MKMMKKRYLKVAIAMMTLTSAVYAGNSLAVVRPSSNTFEVQLANSEEIFGVQFSLKTSSDIILGQLERGGRTSESHWIVASYKPNDSTMNVLILSIEKKNFSNGNGTLVRIPFTASVTPENSYASLTNVMVTNSRADSLGIVVNDLSWSNNDNYLAENGSKSFQMGQNFPNPFNPRTRIAYKLNKAAQVRLIVYDITGREVNRLVDQYQGVGDYSVEWNSNSSSGQKLASGMYIAYLSVDNEKMSRKMLLTK